MVGIIPAAGRGTRMASVSGGMPKELLRLGRNTVVGRIVEEARGAGCDRIIVVSSPEKPQLTDWAETNGCEVVFQPEVRGAADAVALAEVEEDALIFLGDVAYFGDSPADRMGLLLSRAIDGAIACEEVGEDQVHLYGILDIDPNWGRIERITEKPEADLTPSRWAIASRYALSKRWMAELPRFVHDLRPDAGELGLSEVLNAILDEGADLKAVALSPTMIRCDCGHPASYREATQLPW